MPKKAQQLSALDKLPVRFVLCIVGTQYLLFVFFWSLPGLQFDVEPMARDPERHRKALVGSVFFHFAVVMFIWSFYQTLVTDPGGIPDTREWKIAPDPLKIRERDLDGQLRFCKYERKYKPDRCHYCSQMKRNILRMDHFCPWVANGVGFGNYKFFLLCLLYGNICLISSTWCMGCTFLQEWNNMQIQWGILYFNFLGAFLGGYMSVIVFPFFVFHLWLTSKNMTTIEFCEMTGQRRQPQNYDLGNRLYNIATVLGINPHIWLWPVGEPIGDGLTFERGPKTRSPPRSEYQSAR